jgi:hypothetical protein
LGIEVIYYCIQREYSVEKSAAEPLYFDAAPDPGQENDAAAPATPLVHMTCLVRS